MFDLDGEEVTNMIWGDDDHIVPYKVRSEQLSRKDQSDESNKAVKPAEQTKTDLHDGSSSGHNVDERIPQPGFCMSSWSDSSPSNAREANPASYSSKTVENTSELWEGPDIFHSTATDERKEEQGEDFDEYGWGNIGSFDDLDRMFSNDVPIFGDGSLTGADELLWSSSKDVSNSPSKPLPSVLDPQELGLDIRTVFEQQENQQFPLTGKANDGLYHDHKGQPSVENQTYHQTKMMKFSEMCGASKAGTFHDGSYGRRTLSKTSPGKFVNQLAPSQSSLMAINLQSESQGSGTLSHYPHMPNQYMATSGFGNHTNPYSTVPAISAVQRPDVKNQLMLLPSYNPATAISLNMVTDASARPSTMTPQEKLEKLRRRQQMQAMLAIQRQQQQFRHQVPLADQYITQNCCQDNHPLQLVDKANLHGLTAMPSFDPNSSLELGDSGNFAAAVDDSSEFSVLYRLQDVVSKLDMGTRTCIRDSLFRLANSAGQRHHTSDKSSQDDQEVIPKEKSRYRYGRMLDTETVTNPTDRTVAHLLFQRPFDMLAVKHMEGPESPASSKMGTEEKGTSPKCSTREGHINKQKAKEEDIRGGSLALGNAANSGSSSTVGERVVKASQGNKRKL
ncbi:hypothetical protein N665_0452s0009 [Sinapis alba]|nr:hypothetical protein N665_0452s0009 [Sinapis alba]